MAPRNRALFAFVGLTSAIAAGCSGGKTGTTPPVASSSPTSMATSTAASATASPTAASSIGPIVGQSSVPATAAASSTPFVLRTATPVPAATSAPSGLPLVVNSRPLANGDAFAYSGTTTVSYVYAGTSPSPSATTVAAVKQNVTVASGKTYNGATGLSQFTTTETDTTPLQATTITTNAYYALTAGPTNSATLVSQNAVTNYGYTSTASTGESIADTITSPGYANNSGTIDLVPEQRSPTWTNGLAQKIVTSESDGFTATRTYAANGTYVENATYPQNSAASPQPTPLTATITQNADGSGSYSLPLFGPPDLTFSYGAPSAAGAIAITLPDDTGSTVFSTQVSAWFAQPTTLYAELDRDNGAVTYPAACNVPSTYGSQGNEVEQKFTRTDTVVGTLEFFDQLTYVASNGVAACIQLSDVTYVFYDYSGQTNVGDVGIGFNGGNSPLETQTVTTTLGVTGATVNSAARHSEAANAAGTAGVYAIANARANFLTTVDRARTARERRMMLHYSRLARLHR